MINDDARATLCPLKQHPNASRHNPSCASSLAYVHDWIPGETLVFEHSRGPQSLVCSTAFFTMTPRSRRKSCALLLLAGSARAFAPIGLATPLIRAATPAAARSNGDACRPSACEATEAFRRGLEARFVTGTLTERAPAGPGELASILRMRAVLDEPPDAWDALCGEECTIEW